MSTKPGLFSRLQWKLTLSYALVTIAVLGLLYLTLFILAFITRQEFVSGSPSLSGSPEGLPALIRSIVRMFLSPLPIILDHHNRNPDHRHNLWRAGFRRTGQAAPKDDGHAASWGQGDFSGRISIIPPTKLGALS